IWEQWMTNVAKGLPSRSHWLWHPADRNFNAGEHHSLLTVRLPDRRILAARPAVCQNADRVARRDLLRVSAAWKQRQKSHQHELVHGLLRSERSFEWRLE